MKTWKIPLHRSTIGREEIAAVVKTMKAGQITMGETVRKFEQAWEKRTGRHCVMVNSGSSANLVMWEILTSPLRTKRIPSGSEVIVPSLCWSTTVWPIVQTGLVPVFVDVQPHDDYTMDPVKASDATGWNTFAICPINLYGKTARMNNLFFVGMHIVEDCCEGTEPSPMAEIATLSFYYSHHMTTGEGGMVVCKNEEDANLARMIRSHGWLRDVSDAYQHGVRPDWAEDRFTFVHAGYNLRPTELSAAIGLVQLKKLKTMNGQRMRVASIIANRAYDYAPFGVKFLCDNEPHRRNVVKILTRQGIETRPILCGNMPEQPGMIHYEHRVHSDEVARRVARCGFSVGCAGVTLKEADRMRTVIKRAMA